MPILLMIRGKRTVGNPGTYRTLRHLQAGVPSATGHNWPKYSDAPIRKYTYDASDPEARRASLEAAESQGGASVFLCPDGSKLEFIEPGNLSGSSDMYSALTDRYNAEMSKAVLGNTTYHRSQ